MLKHLVGVAAVAAVVCPVLAQPKPQTPFLSWEKEKGLTLQMHLNVRTYWEPDPNTSLPVKEAWNFETAAVVFPMISKTAGSTLEETAVKTSFTLNDRVSGITPVLLPNYPCGARLGRWDLKEWKGEELGLDLTLPVKCANTIFDEAKASGVQWTKRDLPPEAASCFKPQFYIDVGPEGAYDMTPIKDLVSKWCNGKDPRTIPPVQLAKYLAGETVKFFQPSGSGLTFLHSSELQGIELQGAPFAADQRRGTEFDMVTVLTAIYREAGIPARIVIGVDTERYEEDDKLFGKLTSKDKLRAWVEWCLVDDATGSVTWVPVDPVRLRKTSSRLPALDKPWKYFGTHDELNGIVPFAFQFHPPTTVRAYGAPAFWGWLVTPAPPERAWQALRFNVIKTPIRGDQPPEREPGRRY